MPLYLKAIILAVVGLFLIIGVIGLILPIIPGILFLALAALLLAKVSSRFSYYLSNNATWNRFKRYFQSVGFLSIAQQIKLSFLIVARSVVSAVEAGMDFLRQKSR
jgi:hypothetical protein|tara:strand:+ start:28938 stop:29255 length:318 start_codon:yes stop_codon:yes gene_type:complete